MLCTMDLQNDRAEQAPKNQMNNKSGEILKKVKGRPLIWYGHVCHEVASCVRTISHIKYTLIDKLRSIGIYICRVRFISTTNLDACVCMCLQNLTNFCPYALISTPNVP